MYLGQVRLVCSIAAWALAACGRFGFDGLADATDETAVPIEPLELAIPTYSTTSTTFTAIPGGTIEVPPSPGRRWLLLTRASLHSSSLDQDAVEIRYVVDGIERGIGGAHHHQVGKGGPWQHLYAFDGGTAPITIGFELRDALATVATVEDLRAVVLPLPEGSTSVYASDDTEQMVTSTAFVPTVVLDAPVRSVEYVFFALAVGKELAGSDIHVEWTGPDGTVRLRDTQNTRGSWQSQFAVWRETVTAPTASFTMSSHVSNGTNVVRDTRVFGVPTTDFPSIDFTTVAGPLDTTSPTPTMFAELAPLGTAPRYLLVATSRVDDADLTACGAGTFADRQAAYRVDEAVVATTSYVISNCAHEATNGAVALLGERPGRLAIDVASGTGEMVRATDASILLLGLP